MAVLFQLWWNKKQLNHRLVKEGEPGERGLMGGGGGGGGREAQREREREAKTWRDEEFLF